MAHGAQINQTNKKGETTTFFIAKSSQLSKKQMTKTLKELNVGANNLCIRDNNGWTCIIHANEHNNFKFIKWVASHSPESFLIKDNEGRVISHFACIHDNPAVLQLLHKLKAENKISKDILSAKDNDLKNVFHYCIEHHSYGTLKHLISIPKYKYLLKKGDKNGDTPLSYIIQFGNIKLLNELHNDVGLQNFVPWSHFLQPASEEGRTDIIEWILKKVNSRKKSNNKLTVNYEDGNQRTCLHYVCMRGHPKALKFLIDKGGDLNVTDYKGRTPAFFASQHGNASCLKILIDNGAQIEIPNVHGVSPEDIARQNNNIQCVKLLSNLNYKQ